MAVEFLVLMSSFGGDTAESPPMGDDYEMISMGWFLSVIRHLPILVL